MPSDWARTNHCRCTGQGRQADRSPRFSRTVAPDGYAGSIRLLVGIGADGRLLGVRVVAHRETPGLGDAIDERKSTWIDGFKGRSLGDPALERWHVKKDGGDFDQFTGATVTPRAVVGAVLDALLYFEANRATLLAAPRG